MEYSRTRKGFNYNPRFLEFIELFAKLEADSRLFPKKCGTCGALFRSFPEYIHSTEPVGHGFEDCSDTLTSPSTMQYRNCSCGSTLAIILTEDVYPILDRFWEMLGKESKETGQHLKEVVSEFRDQCNRYIIAHDSAQTE